MQQYGQKIKYLLSSEHLKHSWSMCLRTPPDKYKNISSILLCSFSSQNLILDDVLKLTKICPGSSFNNILPLNKWDYLNRTTGVTHRSNSDAHLLLLWDPFVFTQLTFKYFFSPAHREITQTWLICAELFASDITENKDWSCLQLNTLLSD